MAKSISNFLVPPNLAVADGATTPDPGGTAARGVVIWSTTTSSLLRWSGTAWNAVDAGGGGSFTNTIVSSTPSGNQQDWSISGLTAFSTVQATQTNSAFVGGIVAGSDGQILRILNRGAGMLWLVDEDPESTASNRLSLPDNLVILLPNEAAEFQYSTAVARWVLCYAQRDVLSFDPKGMLVLPNNGANVTLIGGGSTTVVATLTTNEPVQNGNPFSARANMQIQNGTANGASEIRGGQLRWFRGQTANRSGLLFGGTFRNTSLGSSGSVLFGVTGSTAASTAQARTINNSFGIGTHGGETTHRVYSRDGAAATAIDLGANFPAGDNAAAYAFYMFAPPASSAVHYAIRRMDTEFKASGTLTSNLPAQTQGLAPRVQLMVGATAATNTMQINYMKCESVY